MEKRDEIGRMSEECMLGVLGLSVTKLRGKGRMSFRVLEELNLLLGEEEIQKKA